MKLKLELTFLLFALMTEGSVYGQASVEKTGRIVYTPIKWERFVPVKGQALPVPEQWLKDEEARIAHDLVLPEGVPGIQPFDFDKARWKAIWPSKPSVALQYIRHLCEKEAGEWIFRKVENVEGFYFARPMGMPGSGTLTDPYGPEAPWVERLLELYDDNPMGQAGGFVSPPNMMFHFVEQPRRYKKWDGQPVEWQANIKESFIRLFGYTTQPDINPNGSFARSRRPKDPMQVIGIPQTTARYAYTWRGLLRERDREHGIAGGELIIYERESKEILAVRRNFLFAGKTSSGQEKSAWTVAARCPELTGRTETHMAQEIDKFAFDVMQTVEPSALHWSK